LLLFVPARGRCFFLYLALLATVRGGLHFTGYALVLGWWLAVGVGGAGLLLFVPARSPCYLISLALLATVRGGTSFLFPTAKKKQKQRKRLSNR
jgi:hypothetical protein